MKNKLTVCKTCGAELAKSANACPNCGAKQHQGVYALCTIIGLLTVILCVFIFVDSNNQQSGNSESTADAIAVSSSDLWKAYEENKVNADNLYKDKTLAVTGTIVNITQDVLSKDPCVSLSAGAQAGIYDVQCFFTDADAENQQLAALQDGQSITIIGTCTGTPLVNVQLTDCHLSD